MKIIKSPAHRIRKLELLHSMASLERSLILLDDELKADIQRILENVKDLLAIIDKKK